MTRPLHSLRGALAVLAFAGLATGCATAPSSSLPDAATAEAFQDCRAEALQLERAAGGPEGSPARYVRAAALAEQCLNAAGPDYGDLEVEAMRLQHLAVLAAVRGGDLKAAQAALTSFEQRFPGRDLYLADGSSVTESLTALLALHGDARHANVGRPLRAELDRLQHWQHH